MKNFSHVLSGQSPSTTGLKLCNQVRTMEKSFKPESNGLPEVLNVKPDVYLANPSSPTEAMLSVHACKL